MSDSNPALPAPQSPNPTAISPARNGRHRRAVAGLSPIQVLALVAIALCVGATAWARISSEALATVQIPLAGVSLLCAFMSPAALPDWRGKVGFVVFMLFTGFVALTPDLTERDPAPILDDTVGIHPSAGHGTQTLRPGRPRRSGELGVAAAYLHLRSLPGAPDPPAPAADEPAATPRGGTDPLVLRLDSIVAIHDGSAGTTDWRFDVYVNRHLQRSLGRDIYQDTPARRTTRFVGPGWPIVSLALTRNNTLTVQVQGVRSALFGNYMASGRSETFPLDELDGGRPKQVVVPVVSDRADHGEFSFFFTVRRV
ncbi:MAG TPA: hypothetical protein VF092_02900 [Longimicrobium sp.]